MQRLLADESMHLASLDHVEGLARRFGYFQPVTLKRGSVDPRRDLPAADIHLLSTTANLVVRDELHPALAYLLLEAARQVHRGPSLIHAAGEFPSPKATEFPLAPAAERYFRDGRPFLLNYLPFWMANFVQRLVFLLVPLAAILVPLVAPAARAHLQRQKRGLYRRYGELKFLEKDLTARTLDDRNGATRAAQLDRIEERARSGPVPARALGPGLHACASMSTIVRAQPESDRHTDERAPDSPRGGSLGPVNAMGGLAQVCCRPPGKARARPRARGTQRARNAARRPARHRPFG